MKVDHRYFLKRGQGAEREVTREEFILVAAQALDRDPAAFEVPGLVGRIKTDIEE